MHPLLYKAVTEGNSASLLQLLEAEDRNLYPQQRDQNKNTLLHIAANFNNIEVVTEIQRKLPTTILRSRNYRRDTALHIAARHNNADVVDYLLAWARETDDRENRSKRRLTVKLKNSDGNTALHEAILGSHRRVTMKLMDPNKEVIFIKNKRNESPLYLAADRGLFTVLRKMLTFALEEENSQKMKDLAGPEGKTPLHAAVAKKRTLCVIALLDEMKEFISKVDAVGRTPLHYAASFGHFEEVRFLLHQEARFLLPEDTSIAHKKDDQGLYPIQIAANKGHVDTIQVMLDHCPETIEALNEYHQNIVHLAAKSGRANLVSYMVHRKSSKFHRLLNEKDIDGNTPLHLATMNSHPRVLSILLMGNVDKNIMNKEDRTALDIAVKQMDEKISLPEVLTLTALRINDARNTIKDTRKIKHDKEMFKERFNTLGLVATLISTVTFAAGFTVPGGYNADGPYKGIAVLLRKPAFNVFVICNTIALYLSIIVAVNNIWAQLGDIRLLILAVNLGAPLLGIALIMMAIAFAAGLYSVIYKLQWLAFVVFIIGAIFMFYIVVLIVLFIVPYMSKYPVLRQISKWGFNFLIWAFDRSFDDRTIEDPDPLKPASTSSTNVMTGSTPSISQPSDLRWVDWLAEEEH